MNFVDPVPVVDNVSDDDSDSHKVPVKRKSQPSPGLGLGVNGDSLTSGVDNGLEVVTMPVTCVRRRYKMVYIPSGFWSRLISRLIINLKRSGLEETGGTTDHPSVVYWKRGIMVQHTTGRFLVESIHSSTTGEVFLCTYTVPLPVLLPVEFMHVSNQSPQHCVWGDLWLHRCTL